MTRHASGSIMELLLAVAEDSATLRSDMSAVYGVGGESDPTDIALFFGNRSIIPRHDKSHESCDTYP